jgi:cyclase
VRIISALAVGAGIFAAARAGAQAPAAAPPSSPPSAHFRLVSLGSGAYAAIATAGDRAAVGNAGFVVGSDAVLVVDAFATEEAAAELLAQIRRTTPLPVRWVVDTHYHYDHLGGNGVFRRAGAVVVAHENVRRWERTENLKWRKELTAADRAMRDALVLPDVTHRGRMTLWLGGRPAEVLFRPGHSGSDSIVRVSGAEGDVVFAGDLFWNATVPNLIDADTAAWVGTLEGFLRDQPSAMFVPGHGEPGRALAVRFFHDYLAALRQSVAHGIEQHLAGDALSEATLAVLKPRFGAWTWFDQFAASNVAQTEQEMRGTTIYAR